MLYNVDAFGLPTQNYPQGFKFLKYSNHAIKESNNDRYGSIDLPCMVDCSNAKLIEVEIEESEIKKLIYRTSFSDSHDVCLVVIPQGAAFFVKTVWLNEVNDTHKTLNKAVYSNPV